MPKHTSKSADVIAIGTNRLQPRLHPPTSLSKDERALFAEIVASRDPRHFVESDLPLLVSYVQATLMAHAMAREAGKTADWEKAVRVQAMLARSLRLTPQSRMDPKVSALRAGAGLSIYERMALDEE